MNFGKLGQRLTIWRYKKLQAKHIRLILSIVVGAVAGLTAVTMKNTVHFMQDFLTNDFASEYHNYYFFIYPFIGLSLSRILVES